jgi:hypothetical protein
MAYSPAAHNTATAGRAGFVRLGTGVGGQSDGTLVTTSVPIGSLTGTSPNFANATITNQLVIGGDLIVAGTPGSAKTFTLSPNASSSDLSSQNVTINLGNPAGGNPPNVSTINFRNWIGGAGGDIRFTNGGAFAFSAYATGTPMTFASSAGTAITIPAATINTQVGGKILLGDMALAANNTRTVWGYVNTSTISVWPTLDINRTGSVTSADALSFIKMIQGTISVTTATAIYDFPQAINHYANTGTGISIIDTGILAASVGRTDDGAVFITSANKGTGFIKNYLVVGNVGESGAIANVTTGVTIWNDSTATVGTYITASTPITSANSVTGALVVNGGVGIGGNLNVGGGGRIATYDSVNGSSVVWPSRYTRDSLGFTKSMTSGVGFKFPYFGGNANSPVLSTATGVVYELEYKIFLNNASVSNILSLSANMSGSTGGFISGIIEYNNGTSWVCKAVSTQTTSTVLATDIAINTGVSNFINVYMIIETGNPNGAASSFYLYATPTNTGTIQTGRNSRIKVTYIDDWNAGYVGTGNFTS